MSCPIVVPLDGTYESERVLPLAVEIAQRASAPLVLLRVDETAAGLLPRLGERAVSHREALRRHLDQRYALDVIAADLRSKGVENVHVALESGSVGPTIVRYARDVDASFVAMSTREGGGVGAVMWGRIAEVVIRQTRLPVLVEPATAVRPRGSRPVGRILVALDGTDLGEAILGPVVELAKLCSAEVTL